MKLLREDVDLSFLRSEQRDVAYLYLVVGQWFKYVPEEEKHSTEYKFHISNLKEISKKIDSFMGKHSFDFRSRF